MGRATRRKLLVRTRHHSPPAARVSSPTFGVLRLVRPASDEIAILGGGHVAPITHGTSTIGRA
ncbi:MAG TPA: hypothetical protein VFN11_20250, partial [Ktedonobacterales bacterium]|nr:hypothetical protein [Ktedonobacterales bacterium]